MRDSKKNPKKGGKEDSFGKTTGKKIKKIRG